MNTEIQMKTEFATILRTLDQLGETYTTFNNYAVKCGETARLQIKETESGLVYALSCRDSKGNPFRGGATFGTFERALEKLLEELGAGTLR